MKLKDEEYIEMTSIVEEYTRIQTSFDDVQKQLKKLSEQKDILLERLEVAREKELAFFSKLNESYGEGKFDPVSLEYILNIQT